MITTEFAPAVKLEILQDAFFDGVFEGIRNGLLLASLVELCFGKPNNSFKELIAGNSRRIFAFHFDRVVFYCDEGAVRERAFRIAAETRLSGEIAEEVDFGRTRELGSRNHLDVGIF